MARRLRRSAPLALLAILALPVAAPAADTLYAVSKDDRLITINSSVPANLERAVRILGLPQGERVLAIDVRPENDMLMGVTTSSRIVELNPVTGLARPVGRQVPFSPALSGGSFGFDFNPTVDRIRLVSDADQNLRIGPNTGLTTFRDDRLAYAPGDPSARTNPAVGAVAYSNSVADATTTTLFGIDSGRDTLVRQDPPNDGVLKTVGRLGVDAVEPVAFDITPAGVGYASFRRAGQKGTELFTVNLANGRARGTADRPVIATGEVRALAIAGPAPKDRRAPDASIAVSTIQTESRLLRRGLDPSVSCDEECLVEATVRLKGLVAGEASETIADGPGRRTIDIRLDALARRIIRRPGSVRMVLTVRASDSAGNRRTQTRFISTR